MNGLLQASETFWKFSSKMPDANIQSKMELDTEILSMAEYTSIQSLIVAN